MPEERENLPVKVQQSPELQIILSVITSIPAGQRTSPSSASLSYLGQPLISFQTASLLSGITEEGRGDISGPQGGDG